MFGQRSSTRKIIASDPIHAQCVTSWDELRTTDQGVLILNGNSSRLPVPDRSVDAVITDPPYFDFVHYSELSDFFFAWLSPVLKSRYPWFGREDSSDKGEVQHKDPRAFARQLACVFSECCRVLKDDGVLAFSFHHSRAEGWAAIHEAITNTGLSIIAAHPVHAELRAANPKAAAKDPISLDAILVCKKRIPAHVPQVDQRAIVNRSIALTSTLLAAGMSISSADRFVIVASQTLVALSNVGANFEAVCNTIMQASKAAQQGAPGGA